MIEEQLLTRLRLRANARGIVPVRGDMLVEEVESTTEEVRAALQKLERAGLIEVLAPFPFLVVKLRMWPGKRPNAAELQAPAYSYSSLASKESQKSHSYPPDAALLAEILETLGESDPASFEGAIRNFPPEIIRRALDRVRRAKSLRKNPTALFRYLLTKLS